MGSRLFRPSGEGRVVFSGQPEVDCTSWNVSQHSSCYSYFRFVKVINRLIRPSVRRPPRVGGRPKPRHPADCVAQFSSCGNFSGFVKRKFLLNFERGGRNCFERGGRRSNSTGEVRLCRGGKACAFEEGGANADQGGVVEKAPPSSEFTTAVIPAKAGIHSQAE